LSASICVAMMSASFRDVATNMVARFYAARAVHGPRGTAV
jgi:hypothetical protein